MQNKLGELSNQRYMDTISEQDRLMRERGAEADVRARGLKQYESGINVEEHLKKLYYDVAAKNSGYDAEIRAAQLAQAAGDAAGYRAHMDKAFEIANPVVTAGINALAGKVNPEDLMAGLRGLGQAGYEKLMTEAGQAGRAATGAGLEEKRQGIDVQKLGLEKAKLGLEKEKFVAEGGTTSGKTTDYYKAMHSKIGGVQKYLASMKEYVESGGDVSTSVDWEKLLAGPTTPKLLGQALSKLSSYDTKAMKKPLTPEEEAWIDRAWDIVNLQEEEKTGGLGASIPIAGATAGAKGAVLSAPTSGANMTPAPAVDATAPSAHTTGEKKTVVINGVSATYIWDGTKWLLSDSR
jgi:hypothetical protein